MVNNKCVSECVCKTYRKVARIGRGQLVYVLKIHKVLDILCDSQLVYIACEFLGTKRISYANLCP